MFGFGPSDYNPRSDYMRAIAEEQMARQQQARMRRQQPQYGLSPFAQPAYDEDDYGYGFSPQSFPAYGAGRDRLRDAQYRAALEEEARRERAERQRAQELLRLRQQEEARARAQAELERRQAYEAAMREREREIQRRRTAAEEAWKARAEMERQRRREEELRREQAQRQLRERFGLRTQPEQTTRAARSTQPQVPYAQTVPYGARARTTSPARSQASISSSQPHAEAPPHVCPAQHTQKYTEEQIAAAETIQAALRSRKIRKNAFSALDGLSKSFRELRAGFTPPPVLEFLVDDVATPVPTANVPLPSLATPFPTDDDAQEETPTPKLAYTTASMPLHAYDEELARLLGRLDAVESGGDLRVRNRRRALVRRVEGEAVRMEKWRGLVWKAHVDSLKEPAPSTLPINSETDNSEVPSDAPAPAASPSVDIQTADDSNLFTPGSSVETQVHLHPPSMASTQPDDTTPPVSDVTDDSMIVEDPASSHPPPSTLTPTNDQTMQAPLPSDEQPVLGGIDSLAAELAAPALESAPHEPEPVREWPSELQQGASLLTPDRELASSEVLPLSNVLGSQHPVDPTRPVPVVVQDQADDVSHVVGERTVHRGFGAEVQNVPRMGVDVLRQLGHHVPPPDEAGGANPEMTAGGEDARVGNELEAEGADGTDRPERIAETDAGVRGGTHESAISPGPVPQGENWADGEEEKAYAELATRAAEAGEEGDGFVLVDRQ